jgi:hypothetical protein
LDRFGRRKENAMNMVWFKMVWSGNVRFERRKGNATTQRDHVERETA